MRYMPMPSDPNVWLQYGIDMDSRSILLNGDIDEETVGLVIRALYAMQMEDRTQIITIYISSYGGNVYDGMGLIDVIRTCAVPVHTVAIGKIMSMGAFIFAAGHSRFSYENTTIMLHPVSYESGYQKLGDHEVSLKESKRINKAMEKMLLEQTGADKEKLLPLVQDKDYYFTAKQAKKIGLVHKIIQPTQPSEISEDSY